MDRGRRSFERAQAHYENDSAYGCGIEEFKCAFCGHRYDVRWESEYGSAWYNDELTCPECGWDNDEDTGQPYETMDDQNLQAPCPICGLVAYPVGYSGPGDELLHLSCGHWIRDEAEDNWEEYSYEWLQGDLQKMEKMGEAFGRSLKGIDGFEEFIKKIPRAGENQSYFEELRRKAEAENVAEKATRRHS